MDKLALYDHNGLLTLCIITDLETKDLFYLKNLLLIA